MTVRFTEARIEELEQQLADRDATIERLTKELDEARAAVRDGCTEIHRTDRGVGAEGR
jgi:uncharacterized coiled-coil protein SlyX